ncbi:hypothetical protein FRC16_010183 [Serendipita sp. 398]|nr:hypothetical protein FRC16_010183 [Serendipita sp. 398]
MQKRHEPLTLFNRDSLSSFVAGGFAGAASRTVVSPLERLKIIQQVQAASGGSGQYSGVWRSLVRMWKEEGFKGYMRGNGVNCLRIVPYSAVQFTTYEQCKKFVSSHGIELNTYTRLGSGAVAGIVSVTVTYPLDLVRARLSVASATFSRLNGEQSAASTSSSPLRPSASSSTVSLSSSSASKSLHTSVSRAASSVAATKIPGVWEMTLKVAREEGGFRALYRGLVPTALGVAPYNGINFASYELLKEIICPPDKQTTPRRLLTGALAGSISQTLTYPLDVLRRKSQMASAKGFNKYNGAIDAAITMLLLRRCVLFHLAILSVLATPEQSDTKPDVINEGFPDSTPGVSPISIASIGLSRRATCSAGQYYENGCRTCLAGWSCSGNDQKVQCSQGYYSSSGASSCSPCPKGTYTNQVGTQNSCTTVQGGWKANASSAATSQVQCGMGYYSPGATDTCTICPAGYYCNSQTNSAPAPCVPGRYAPTTGYGQDCEWCPSEYSCVIGVLSLRNSQPVTSIMCMEQQAAANVALDGTTLKGLKLIASTVLVWDRQSKDRLRHPHRATIALLR